MPRFLCPPPTAIMIGNSWWTDVVRRGEDPKLYPPRVVISISGEPVPQEGSIEWTGSSGKSFDVGDPPTGTTYIGRCVGKQLFISDVDEKKKKVEALVKITAPSSEEDSERVIGTFPSRPIKVISKPSKKRQSAKNLERQPLRLSFQRFFFNKPLFLQSASIMALPFHCFTVCGPKRFLQNIFVSLALDLLLKAQMAPL
jgi:hypothetical protein